MIRQFPVNILNLVDLRCDLNSVNLKSLFLNLQDPRRVTILTVIISVIRVTVTLKVTQVATCGSGLLALTVKAAMTRFLTMIIE